MKKLILAFALVFVCSSSWAATYCMRYPTGTPILCGGGESGEINWDAMPAETDPEFSAWLNTDPLDGFLTEESDPSFVDWSAESVGTIHASNYVDNNTTYTSSDFTHNSLSGVSANEHIDWTIDQGATNIHSGNYTDTNTTYTAGRSLTLDSTTINADAELYTDTKCIIIENPTDDDNFLMFRVPVASTITSLNCIVAAATSAVISFQECDSAGANCAGVDGETTITCDADGQADDGTLSNAGIDAGDWIRLDVGTVTGTVGHLTACMTLTKDD
jgi:hypothetical protein